jgi:hypothetical protein
MRKTKLLACLLFSAQSLLAQCFTAPDIPVCTGTESLVTNSDNIAVSQTKYFYGAAASLSNVRLNGGTLVICGDVTLTDFVFDSGVLYIQPGANLVVSNGAGLVVRGNTAIYNKGSFQCLGNYVMDGTYATAAKPNIIVNVEPTSQFKMANQYFVINNPYSFFINNGTADFHGLITDPLAATGSVCLGSGSQTRMTVLYNKARLPYVAPSGPACVSVTQYSQFYDTLTASPNVRVCLSSLHNSDASCMPWGCKPNAWGSNAQVTTGCTACATILTTLSADIINLHATSYADFNEIQWQTTTPVQGYFYVERSVDGSHFKAIDSLKAEGKTAFKLQDQFYESLSYYRVTYNSGTKTSKTIEAKREVANHPHPNPFKNYLRIPLTSPERIVSIKILDMLGREITDYRFTLSNKTVLINFGAIAKGIYTIRIIQEKESRIYKVVKE